MTKLLIVTLVLSLPILGHAQVSGSYQKLKGKRLTQFFKTKGMSEKGRNIAFYLPGKGIPLRNRTRGRTQSFTHKGLKMVVQTKNPYLIQTRRKLTKSTKGQVLVKGRVRRSRGSDRKITHYVFIDTMQKIGGGSKPTKKRKKS